MRIIGHGVDLVEIARIERMLSDHGDRFLARCFTEDERAYAEASAAVRAERYAARFAAKEAVLKALGTGLRDGIEWTDIEVARNPAGAPSIVLRGRALEIAAERGIESWATSLSHAGGMAMASVVASGVDAGVDAGG
jgi:holo-[acyl-carrier protein] synthase